MIPKDWNLEYFCDHVSRGVKLENLFRKSPFGVGKEEFDKEKYEAFIAWIEADQKRIDRLNQAYEELEKNHPHSSNSYAFIITFALLSIVVVCLLTSDSGKLKMMACGICIGFVVTSTVYSLTRKGLPGK